MIRTLTVLSAAAGLLILSLLPFFAGENALPRVLPSRIIKPLLAVKEAKALEPSFSTLPDIPKADAGGLPAESAADAEKFFEALFAGAKKNQSPAAPKNSGALRLFVSFSMPKASLERLARDAKDAGIVLTFAGVPGAAGEEEGKKERAEAGGDGQSAGAARRPAPLLNPESLAAFEPLIATGASVELHPEAFRAWGITEVPALLITPEAAEAQNGPEAGTSGFPAASGSDASCSAAPSDSAGTPAPSILITGDVTLRYMLDAAQKEAPHLAPLLAPCLDRLAGRE
jgi:hypothetical protein